MRNPLTKEQEKIIIKEYVENKRGQVFVCKSAKISIKQLKKFLIENGYHIRNFSEAATTSNINRAKKKDENYFKKETPNMAWILGFLASDGNISLKDNEISLKLSSVDREILEKIKAEIQIENEIGGYITSDGFQISSLSWTCAAHKQDLAKYSIVPNKTFILKPPFILDKKYWIDYIRGYFDGDGSINYLKNNNTLRWQVCSATTEILDFIVDYFYEEFGIPKVSIQVRKRTNNPLYSIQYSTNSTKKIYNILYNTESNLYLTRKKEKFDEIIKLKT